MSKKTDELSENQKLMEEFIQSWARFSMDHPQITLGEWLKALSIMTGLAMSMGDMAEEHIDDALLQMADVIVDVFERADEHITRGTVQ
jgi:hypothetical protein